MIESVFLLDDRLGKGEPVGKRNASTPKHLGKENPHGQETHVAQGGFVLWVQGKGSRRLVKQEERFFDQVVGMKTKKEFERSYSTGFLGAMFCEDHQLRDQREEDIPLFGFGSGFGVVGCTESAGQGQRFPQRELLHQHQGQIRDGHTLSGFGFGFVEEKKGYLGHTPRHFPEKGQEFEERDPHRPDTLRQGHQGTSNA